MPNKRWILPLILMASGLAAAEPARERYRGQLEEVAAFTDAMPTGVAVSADSRIFVCFPRWEEVVDLTVAEWVNGEVAPYPSLAFNQTELYSVQSLVIGPGGRLWLLDTGRPGFKPAAPGAARLLGIDLETGQLVKEIVFPENVVTPETYLNDMRFDLRRGEEGMAFITDSSSEGPNGMIVVDLENGASWRRLAGHPSTRPAEGFQPFVEGRALRWRNADGTTAPLRVGADGIAMGPEGKRLYYSPLSSRRLYSVSLDALADRELGDETAAATVRDHGEKGASDGLESDRQGRIYVTDYEHNAIRRIRPDGRFELLAHDPRLLWPDSLDLAADGYLYLTANQLHRQPGFHGGVDIRRPPYRLFRLKVDGQPVQLQRTPIGLPPPE